MTSDSTPGDGAVNPAPDPSPPSAPTPDATPKAAADASTAGPTPEPGTPPATTGEPGAAAAPSDPNAPISPNAPAGAANPANPAGEEHPGAPPPGGSTAPEIIRPPRRVRHGLKLRGREAPKVSTDLALRMLSLVERQITDPVEAAEGFKYARAGQTVTLEMPPGGPVAKVQGHRARGYRVTMRIDAWSQDRRDAVAGAMAAEAATLAALLDDRLPEQLDEMLARLGLTLLPKDLELGCDCERFPGCRHVLAVGMLVSERLEENPLLALAMREMPADRLLDRLRQIRAMESRGLVSAHPEPDVPQAREEPAPLAESVSDFWRPAAGRVDLAAAGSAGSTDHALLRRLGGSPLGGKFPLVGLLASIYDSVSDEARTLEDVMDTWPNMIGDLAADPDADGDMDIDADEAIVSASEPAADAPASDGPPPTSPPAAAAKPKAKAKAKAKAKPRPRATGTG